MTKNNKDKSREYKARHNIYLSGKKLSDNQIIIRGNKLNLRWFNNCIMVWSDTNNKNPLPKKILEIVENAFGKESLRNDKKI